MDFEVLDSGCCGIAGYFGYEEGDHYDVSIKAGERVLLPAVRSFDSSGLVIADGFSCREQIEQTTERKGLHLAQVLDMALSGKHYYEPRPEKKYLETNKIPATAKQKLKRNVIVALGVGIAVLILSKKILSQNKT